MHVGKNTNRARGGVRKLAKTSVKQNNDNTPHLMTAEEFYAIKNKPMSEKERMARTIERLDRTVDELSVKLSDALEDLAEWRHDVGTQLGELNLRLHDLEKSVEGE
jgi:predicted nucleotide-binding protein (sugar kinase/HSP70/actin superfamily)